MLVGDDADKSKYEAPVLSECVGAGKVFSLSWVQLIYLN